MVEFIFPSPWGRRLYYSESSTTSPGPHSNHPFPVSRLQFHLSHAVNASLSSGNFPTLYKQDWVTLLLKKVSSNPSVMQNYRPVSLLCQRFLRRLSSSTFPNFRSQNNLLDPQFGFKSGHSTETALLLTEHRPSLLSMLQSSVLILLQLPAAFATLNHHDILLSTPST